MEDGKQCAAQLTEIREDLGSVGEIFDAAFERRDFGNNVGNEMQIRIIVAGEVK